jgi:hypothetical protein
VFVERLRLFGQATLRRSISDCGVRVPAGGGSAGNASRGVRRVVPCVLVAGRVAIFAELPAPLGSLPELLRPAALAGPDGTPLTPCVPAPRRTPAIEAFEWSSPRMLFAVRRTPAMMR